MCKGAHASREPGNRDRGITRHHRASISWPSPVLARSSAEVRTWVILRSVAAYSNIA